MSANDSHTPDQADDAPRSPSEPPVDVADGFRKRFGQFLALFGSTAAIAAFLLFAGFLSDFAVYRLAGLPRLSFNLTALTESGAVVAIDTLASLVTGKAHLTVLLLAFSALLAGWACFKSVSWLERLVYSPPAYQLARLTALAFAFLLLAGQVDLFRSSMQRGHDRATIEQALRSAYADPMQAPSPRDRQRHIEQSSYRLTFFPAPNWLESVLDGASRGTSDTEWQGSLIGIPLRVLPESRAAANYVFGWLVLVLIGLTLFDVLLHQWRHWQAGNFADAQSQPDGDEANADPPLSAWGRIWAMLDLSDVVERLVAPLTVLLTVLCYVLLPLSHGLLARPSLGNETVLVTLEKPAEKPEKEINGKDVTPPAQKSADEPSDHPARPAEACLEEDAREKLASAKKEYQEALRDLVQVHESEEKEYKAANKQWLATIKDLTRAVIAHRCPEALQTLSSLRPGTGLAMVSPALAADFRSETDKAFEHYGVQQGTILSYPRDKDDPLTLVETIQPPSLDSAGEWSLKALDRKRIVESVVLPNNVARDVERSIVARDVARSTSLVRLTPDHDALNAILTSLSPEALEATLRLLEEHEIFAPASAVAVTALGRMAFANAANRPDLSTRAIDDLIAIAKSAESQLWPNKDVDIRGAALTALHLASQSYAALRLADIVASEKESGLNCTSTGLATACIPQFPTAVGFLLQTLASEFSNFKDHVPERLSNAQATLFGAILDVAMDEKFADDIRAGACTAILISGVREFVQADKNQKDRYFEFLKGITPETAWFQAACLKSMASLGMKEPQHRDFLRELTRKDWQTGDGSAALLSMTALLTLRDLGLNGEAGFLAAAYLSAPSSDVSDLAGKVLGEVDALELAGSFLKCVEANWQSEPAKAEKCLTGLGRVKEHYDGDDGGTDHLAQIMRQPELSRDLVIKGCEVLRGFAGRNGRVAARLLKNPHETIHERCKIEASNSQFPGDDPRAD